MPGLVTRRDYSRLVLSETGLVSYWRLGETSGTVADDSKGANDGTYTGGVTLGQAGLLAGDTDKAADFVTPAYVLIPGSASLNIRDDFTVEAWFRADTLPSGGDSPALWATVYGANPLVQQVLHLSAGSLLLGGFHDGNNGGWYRAQIGVAAGTLYHAVVTRAGATIKLYLNGVLANTNAAAYAGSLTSDATSERRIGLRWDGSTDCIDGRVDEVAIYNVALTPAQVARHYEAGRQRKRIAVGRSRSSVAVA